MRYADLTGQRFGRLTAISYSHSIKYKGSTVVCWRCKCDCGREKTVRAQSLRRGTTLSCGCYQTDFQRRRNLTHGLSKSPEYSAFNHMHTRCEKTHHPEFHNYGGRGIKVCERWAKFENFYADMGPRPSPRYSLDRIDNNGNYEPSNCRWATTTTQNNNLRHNVRLTHKGMSLSPKEWSRITGLSRSTIIMRIYRSKWTVAEALDTPPLPPRLAGRGKPT